MLRQTCFLIVVASTLSTTNVHAQLQSGPKIGTQVTPFKAYEVTGNENGKAVDFVAERKEKTTVYHFIHAKDFDRPTARFLKKLDQEIANGIDGVTDPVSIAVWMSEDQEKSKAYLPRAQESLQFAHTRLSVFDGGVEGPQDWNLNSGARFTTVIVRNGKVRDSFGCDLLNEADLAVVLKAMKP